MTPNKVEQTVQSCINESKIQELTPLDELSCVKDFIFYFFTWVLLEHILVLERLSAASSFLYKLTELTLASQAPIPQLINSVSETRAKLRVCAHWKRSDEVENLISFIVHFHVADLQLEACWETGQDQAGSGTSSLLFSPLLCRYSPWQGNNDVLLSKSTFCGAGWVEKAS